MAVQTINREISEPFSIGSTAEIYEWEPGWVLKLYFEHFTPRIANNEHHIATAISTAGISALP